MCLVLRFRPEVLLQTKPIWVSILLHEPYTYTRNSAPLKKVFLFIVSSARSSRLQKGKKAWSALSLNNLGNASVNLLHTIYTIRFKTAHQLN